MLRKLITPPRIAVLSFAGVIMLGTLVLWLPAASRQKPLTFLQALFTSTSAVCVTGLTVIDPGTHLSLFGQAMLLLLIQLGGLGIMTISIALLSAVGFRPSFIARTHVQQVLTYSPTRDVLDIARSVILFTAAFEVIGALLLFCAFIRDFPLAEATKHAAFNSVSAFCNAGFSLFTHSLEKYRGNVLVVLTVSGLIFFGGIGFVVLHQLKERFPLGGGRRTRARLPLHAKFALTTSGVLIVMAGVLFFVMEYNYALVRMPLGEKVLASLFHAVTPRTAGFNTVNMTTMTSATVFICLALMFIGASPGSTGGGIKTTTIAVLFALAKSRVQGHQHVNVSYRSLSPATITQATTLTLLSFFIVCAMALVLMIVEHQPDLKHTRFLAYLFEATSAFGTVGLSMNLTPKLSAGGQLVIISLMFIGRLGPITLMYALARKTTRKSFRYAEERVMIG